MKKIIKSLLVLSLVVTTVAGTTKAWFTSNVNAEGNDITTGTLRVSVDTSADGAGDHYPVAYDDGTETVLNREFAPLTNMQPGETRTVYFTARNIGSLPLQYRFKVQGDWPEIADWQEDSGLVSVESIYRYPMGSCSGDSYCEDIYYWLQGASYSMKDATAGTPSLVDHDGVDYYGGHNENFVLEPSEYSIYRMELKLDETAGNAYQDTTYEYDVVVDARQTNDATATWTQ